MKKKFYYTIHECGIIRDIKLYLMTNNKPIHLTLIKGFLNDDVDKLMSKWIIPRYLLERKKFELIQL
jgi:hypothetical protein